MSLKLNLSTNNILVEYIYYNQSSPDIISTDDAGFYLMENAYNNQRSVMNSDGTQALTSNVRNRSAVNIDNKNIKYALLTTNKLGLPYNDFDPKLTSTPNLPLTWTNPEGVIYDTVRVHFIQGFAFNDLYKGVNIKIAATDRNGTKINLLNGVFTYQDNWIILNGRPFLYGGRQYSTYIEFKVPALRYLKDSFITEYQQGSNADILAYKITNGVGFNQYANIEIQAALFSPFSTVNNQIYSTIIQAEETSIPSSDEFNEVGVYIAESNNGDYIEFYGTYNSQIFGDYMNALNNSGNTYIAIHELIVSEQLPNTVDDYEFIGFYRLSDNTPNLANNTFLANFNDGAYWIATETGFSNDLQLSMNKNDLLIYDSTLPSAVKIKVIASDGSEFEDVSTFVRTSEISYVQDSEFIEPNTFRPVLKYGGSALSYRIEYTLKILNVNTNSIVEKEGSFLSFEPSKYGQELIKINLKDNIQTFDVYNKKFINVIGQGKGTSEDSNISSSNLYSKNITSFKETKDINVSASTVIVNEDNQIVDKSSSGTKNVFGQNLASIFISPFDTYILFNIFDVIDKEIVSYDLSKAGLIYMNFNPNNGEIIKVAEEVNPSVKRDKGQVLFRITKDIYNQVSNSVNSNFFITSRVGKNSAETLLYSGRFIDSTKKTEDDIKNTYLALNNKIKELESIIADQSSIIAQQQTTIKTLNANALTYKEQIEREIAKRVKEGLTAHNQTLGKTANDKEINRLSLNMKSSNFNNFGPTSRGQTSR